MSGRTAHILEAKWRSDDIRSGEDADFSSLLLPKEILKGLKYNGFKYPSPIQLKAIPVGKIGKDLIVQAKSGTGKTLVFTVVALNMLLKGATHPQVLILAPTREIACQISKVIRSVSCTTSLGVKCDYFIGGLRLEEDVPRIQGCNVIVGTPGRIKQLISYKILKTAGIRLFVLDEADQLLKESSFITDIDDIFRTLPQDKQMIATSATYPDKLKRLTDKYFRDPLLIRLNKNDIGLLGMVHYYHIIPVSKLPVVAYKEKLKFLENVLLSIKFAQCLVFCNMVSRVENLCVEIKKLGFATSYISSAREQEDRLKAIELLKRFKCKILVSSDVSSRGIDAENVDLVINFDLPSQLDTYFHRVGRAGRYGSKCASVTFITSDEVEAYKRMQIDGNFKSFPLPDCVPEDLISLQLEKKPSKNNEELSLDDGSESSSDLSQDIEDLNENEIVKQEKTNGFSEDIELNGHNELSCVSKNLANLSDKKLSDFEVESGESGDFHDTQNHLLDCNSNPTNSVKEDDDLSSTSESAELESDKIDSPACVNLKQPEVVEEVSKSPEIIVIENESNLKVNISNGEESCENTKLVERKVKQRNIVTLGMDNSENYQSKFGQFANKIHGLQDIADTSSHLIDLENDSNNLLEEKSIDGKSLVMNSKFNTSKIFNDPKSKELISSCITYVEDYENCNKGSDEISTAGNAKYAQSINVESNDNKFSPGSLKQYRSSLSQYHFDVCKDFIVNSAEDLINEGAQGCGKESVNKVTEIEKQECLNDGENKIQNSSLDSQLMLFSTPKTEAFSAVKSVSSSSVSSSGSDKDKLHEHFNLNLPSIQKVKPSANKSSTSESSSDSESNTDISVNSDDALHMLAEEFNKVSNERADRYNKGVNIINLTDPSSCSSSSSSDSDTSVDSEEVDEKLEQKLNETTESERSEDPKKYMEETKKILREIQSTRKCFKDLKIPDAIKCAKSSTSSSSDSDTSIDNGEAKGERKREFNKQIQNVKNTVVNTRKSSESSSYKTTTINGHAENKIPHYSDTESDVDQYSKESTSDLQDGHRRKTWKKGKAISKDDSGPIEIKRGHYYSRTNSSETENDIVQYSKESGSSYQVDHQRKRKCHKKKETLPKIEPPQFDYSNTNGTSNPYFNPASERPMFYPPHSSYQMQPSYYASNPHNIQYTQQIQNHADQGPFWGAHSNYQMQPTPYVSNSYYPSYPQQTQSYVNEGQIWGTQSSHYMHPTYVPNPLNHPYPSECPLKECCQMHLLYKPAGVAACCSSGNSKARRNSNPPTNHVQSNSQMQSSQYAYNQCSAPSQHPCHPPNGTCQSPACAAWYDLFYKQWQYINQSPYF